MDEIIRNILQAIYSQNTLQNTLVKNQEIERLKNAISDPKSLIPFGQKVYSQNEEDGLIIEIFKRIGKKNGIFVELGVGDGLENNTLALLFQGWRGLWIEGNGHFVSLIRNGFDKVIDQGILAVEELFIDQSNINTAISNSMSSEIDLLSVDLDGNDWHIFSSISIVEPRVVILEYNARFAPPIKYCMAYNQEHVWTGGDKFGMSLQFAADEMEKRGYLLVGCNLTGSNAFFVRKEEVEDRFCEPGNAEYHFQPARYYLSPFPGAHPADYETLNSLY